MTKTIDTRTLEASFRRATSGGDYVTTTQIAAVTGMTRRGVWKILVSRNVPRVGQRNARYYIPRAAEALMTRGEAAE